MLKLIIRVWSRLQGADFRNFGVFLGGQLTGVASLLVDDVIRERLR